MSLRSTRLLLLSLSLLALAAACGGGGNGEREEGVSLTPTTPQVQPMPSPSASPSPSTPLPSPTPAGGAQPLPEIAVTPVAEPFEITVKEAVNIRDRPSVSTESNILGVIYPGHKATVLGEARGQEVEEGKGDLWYQIELPQTAGSIKGFVYAPLVEKAE